LDIIYRYDPFTRIAPRPESDAASAIRALQEGHERYATIVSRVQKEILGGTVSGPMVIPSDPLSLGLPLILGDAPVQAPFALVLGCSDARVPIEQIFDLSPNDLFVIRVAGNVLGVECLGSIDFAVQKLGESMKLLVILGHTGCGAVTAAVDAYLEPQDYAVIAFTHALRSLVDRVQIAVRGAAHALERCCGASVAQNPGFRAALVEMAVYLNAAITAFDVSREVQAAKTAGAHVVYGVFDLVGQRVRALPAISSAAGPAFGEVPDGADGFGELGNRLAEAIVAKGLLA
jgi:carbonic anhydrase